MNEQERKEAQRRLEDEERRRRMSEGGETMRAQLAMEEKERAARSGERREESYLTPQEEQQRRMMRGEGDVNRGLGETQKAEQAMWGQGKAGGAPTEERRRVGEQQVSYPAGTGSYYSETSERPTGTAGPESSFGRVEGEPRERVSRGAAPGEPERERALTKEEMLRTGSDQTVYPAGSGSYYSETFERPTGPAGPESSFGRTENVPSGRRAGMTPSEEAAMPGRMGAYPTQEPTAGQRMGERMSATTGETTAKMKETGGDVYAKGKDVGGQVMAKTKEYTSKITESAKGATKGQSAEDVAHRAGEVIGKAIHKTVSVAKEMGSGLRSGLGEGGEKKTSEMEARQTVTEKPRREVVERETEVSATPEMEERKYRETKRKEEM